MKYLPRVLSSPIDYRAGCYHLGNIPMHIVTQKRLGDFAMKHPAADVPLRVWEAIISAARYKNPHEVKPDFGASVDFIGDGKTVFDCSGNKYRIVVKMLYQAGKVIIRHVLTHHQYDRHIKDGTL